MNWRHKLYDLQFSMTHGGLLALWSECPCHSPTCTLTITADRRPYVQPYFWYLGGRKTTHTHTPRYTHTLRTTHTHTHTHTSEHKNTQIPGQSWSVSSLLSPKWTSTDVSPSFYYFLPLVREPHDLLHCLDTEISSRAHVTVYIRQLIKPRCVRVCICVCAVSVLFVIHPVMAQIIVSRLNNLFGVWVCMSVCFCVYVCVLVCVCVHFHYGDNHTANSTHSVSLCGS